jgi:uncharacterized MAPEG superfamily protein
VSVPMWVLLGFAAWTLAVLMGSVGVYRWSRILTGRASVGEWRADVAQGSDWYQRAMRAHMNCVENLPVYGAVAFAAFATGASSPALDFLAVAFLAARICQSLVHIGISQTEPIAALRFALFFVQVLCVAAMGMLIAAQA